MINRYIHNGIVVNGNYRHYKGTVYTVYGVVRNFEDDSEKVLYGCHGCQMWVRSIDSFLADVDLKLFPNSIQKNKFEYMPECDSKIQYDIYNKYIEMDGMKNGMDRFYVLYPTILDKRNLIKYNSIGIVLKETNDFKPDLYIDGTGFISSSEGRGGKRSIKMLVNDTTIMHCDIRNDMLHPLIENLL